MWRRIFNADAVFGMVLLAVSGTFFGMSTIFNKPTADGTVHEGFFPQLTAAVVGVMALLIIIDAIRKNVPYFAVNDEQKASLKSLLLVIGLLILYVIAWPYVHFIVQTTLLVVAMCRIFKMSWKFTVLFTLIFSVGLYYLFTQAFSILL